MKIIRGFVAGVIPMGTDEKPWQLVCITETSKNRHGFEESKVTEFMVAGKQYQTGLHNAYRQLVGAEVFVEISPYVDSYSGKPEIKYRLEGIPLRLMDQPAVTSAPAASAAQAAARATA